MAAVRPLRSHLLPPRGRRLCGTGTGTGPGQTPPPAFSSRPAENAAHVTPPTSGTIALRKRRDGSVLVPRPDVFASDEEGEEGV